VRIVLRQQIEVVADKNQFIVSYLHQLQMLKIALAMGDKFHPDQIDAACCIDDQMIEFAHKNSAVFPAPGQCPREEAAHVIQPVAGKREFRADQFGRFQNVVTIFRHPKRDCVGIGRCCFWRQLPEKDSSRSANDQNLHVSISSYPFAKASEGRANQTVFQS
jgi:hypothetical protein